MNKTLNHININFYNKFDLKISDYVNESESLKYNPCRFQVNGLKIVCRYAKVTPKKVGQFVTFWKRDDFGNSVPLSDDDSFDYYVINVSKKNQLGQFIVPKSALINYGIIFTDTKPGKRGFRIYPPWDKPNSKQAVQTQSWQVKYFIELDDQTELVKLNKLYRIF